MRILFANDGIGDAGGVQTYLAAVMPEIARHGHQVALLHLDPARGAEGSPAPAGAPHFCMQEMGVGAALEAARAWGPDVAFSHNMRPLEVERGLMEIVPTVKMMHGYFGTCIGGQKAHLWPRPEPCGRRFGPACLALYVPRRNGKMSLPYIADQYRWASEQNALFGRYAFVVTASAHMRREYVRNGVHPRRAHAVPLFSTIEPAAGDGDPPPAGFRVLFLGRMTRLKGGDYLIRAAAQASAQVGRSIPLTLAGDGPQRAEWEALAAGLGVDATFPGWVSEDDRARLFRSASLLAVPSVWPEPFGLVGLEAGAFGVPAVAYDVGGIREWLSEGVNGWLAPGDPPTVDGLAALLARAAAHPPALAALRPGALATARRMSLAAHVERLERILAAARGRRTARHRSRRRADRGRARMTKDRAPDERPGGDAPSHLRTSAPSNRAWHLLTGEYPPARGGVGDYTRQLAEALARAGREVHVWAPSPAETAHGVHLHPATFSSGALEGLGYDLDRFPAPRRLLVQYAPQAFGARGTNVAFARWVHARARAGDDVRVMFHEPFFPWVLRRPQRNVISVATRAMAMLLLRAASRAYVSTPAWEELLRRWAPARLGPMRWLPIPATVPRADDPEAVAVLRAKLRGGDPGRHVVGHFGTYGDMVAPLLEPALATVLAPPANTVALLLGEGGPAFAERLERATPGLRGRIVAPGWLPPDRVSVHLQACDVAVQPYPDGASTRRTTLMAAIANGVPTVTTGGRFTEPVWAESPVPLVPANDAAALSVAVLDLLDDPARRRRIGDAARAFYDARFAMERTIDVLLEDE